MFIVSKLLSAITQPAFGLALLTLACLLRLTPLVPKNKRRTIWLLWGLLLTTALLGFKAVPESLLRPLESQYTSPSGALSQYAGIIVLGGATGRTELFNAHQQVPLGEAAERMTAPVGLLHQYPNLQLVFSGGEGRLIKSGITEAELAQRFYQEMGLNTQGMIFESTSRNTRENARQVARLLGARCKSGQWLLITSAWHMPRAMQEFQPTGCNVTPYPVDFRAEAENDWSDYSFAHGLVLWQTALHEWVGLWVYNLAR